jgi:hypothetical protein
MGQGTPKPPLPQTPFQAYLRGTFFFAKERNFLFCCDIRSGVGGGKVQVWRHQAGTTNSDSAIEGLPLISCEVIGGEQMDNARVYKMIFAGVYPHYVAKVEKKGRTKEELHTVICWLTGYDETGLQRQIDKRVDFETFFAEAPAMHPNAVKITGTICGYRIEEIEDELMRKVRYLDKLVDELAKGRAMEKILRA